MTAPATTSPPRARHGTLRVLEREILVFSRLWRGVALYTTITPLLFLGAMGIGLGGLIDQQGADATAGAGYLQFLAPGLLAASVFQTAAGGSLWPVMAGTTWLRTFHGMVATPITPTQVYDGFLLYIGIIRGLVTAVPFLIVAVLLGAFTSAWAVLAVPAAILGGLAAAAPLMAHAGRQELDASFTVINRVGIMPLYLFSGTFFPVEQLPEPIQPAVWLSPLWHAVELARGAALTQITAGRALVHLSVLLGCIAAGVAWGHRTFTQRLAP